MGCLNRRLWTGLEIQRNGLKIIGWLTYKTYKFCEENWSCYGIGLEPPVKSAAENSEASKPWQNLFSWSLILIQLRWSHKVVFTWANEEEMKWILYDIDKRNYCHFFNHFITNISTRTLTQISWTEYSFYFYIMFAYNLYHNNLSPFSHYYLIYTFFFLHKFFI